LVQYQNTAYSIAFRIMRNTQDAQDVVQESYVRAFRSIGNFRNESQFSTWLYRIVFNEAIRARQSNTAHQSVEIPDDMADPDYAGIDDALRKVVADERTRMLRQVLDRLNPNESLVMTLFYLEEKNIRDIHRITGWSTSNIKVLLHRARKNLYVMLNRMMNREMVSVR